MRPSASSRGSRTAAAELGRDVPAQVVHGEQPGQPGDQRLGGAHPADPQAAPDALAQRADRDHGIGVRGQRRRGRHAGESQLAEHLVVDQRDSGLRRGPHQGPPGQRGQHRAGRIVKGGDHVGQGYPVAAAPPLARAALLEPGWPGDWPGRLLVERLQRTGIESTGPSTSTRCPGASSARASSGQRLLGPVGDQDAVRAGPDPLLGVAIGDRPAQRRVARRVVADVARGRRSQRLGPRCVRTPRPGSGEGYPGPRRPAGSPRPAAPAGAGTSGRWWSGRGPAGSAPATPGAAALAPDDPPIFAEQGRIGGDHGAARPTASAAARARSGGSGSCQAPVRLRRSAAAAARPAVPEAARGPPTTGPGARQARLVSSANQSCGIGSRIAIPAR